MLLTRTCSLDRAKTLALKNWLTDGWELEAVAFIHQSNGQMLIWGVVRNRHVPRDVHGFVTQGDENRMVDLHWRTERDDGEFRVARIMGQMSALAESCL